MTATELVADESRAAATTVGATRRQDGVLEGAAELKRHGVIQYWVDDGAGIVEHAAHVERHVHEVDEAGRPRL